MSPHIDPLSISLGLIFGLLAQILIRFIITLTKFARNRHDQ